MPYFNRWRPYQVNERFHTLRAAVSLRSDRDAEQRDPAEIHQEPEDMIHLGARMLNGAKMGLSGIFFVNSDTIRWAIDEANRRKMMPTCRRSTAGRGRSDSHSKIADFFFFLNIMVTMSQTWIEVEDKQQYGWDEVRPHVHLKSNGSILIS